MSGLERLRRALYFAQRGIGDAQAAKHGPAPLAGRLARRYTRRELFRAIRKLGR